MCVPSLFRLSRHLPDGRGFVLRLLYFGMSRNLGTPPIKRLDRLFENGYVTDPARKERSVMLTWLAWRSSLSNILRTLLNVLFDGCGDASNNICFQTHYPEKSIT
jgi:hypothetical protein